MLSRVTEGGRTLAVTTCQQTNFDLLKFMLGSEA